MKKRNDKDTKRRLALQKQNAREEKRIAKYGSGSVAVIAQDVNRRFVAAFLALVFVLTSVIVGYNFSSKAVTGDTVGLDGTYTAETNTPIYTFTNRNNGRSEIQGTKISFTIADGKFDSFTITTRNYLIDKNKVATSTTDQDAMEKMASSRTEKYPFRDAPQAISDIRTKVNALVGQAATYSALSQIDEASYGTGNTANIRNRVYNTIRNILLSLMESVPRKPREPTTIDDYVDPPELPESASSYLELNKTIAPSSNGSAYDLSLESYSSADTSKFEIWEKVPTDYVVVVDQSASMKTEDMATKYVSAGTVNLEDIGDETTTDDKYYYVDPNGDTYRVFAETGYLYEYFESNSLFVGDIIPDEFFSWFTTSEVNTDMKNNYYYKKNGSYKKLNFRVVGSLLRYDVDISYMDDNSIEPTYFVRPTKPKYRNFLTGADYEDGLLNGYNIVNSAVKLLSRSERAYTYAEVEIFGIKPRTGMYINYPMYKRHVGYTRLVYRDKNGDIIPIPSDSGVVSAEYCNGSGQAVTTQGGSTRMKYTGKLLKSSKDMKRLDALKTALQVFTKTVEQDVDSYGSVDNRIAFVGFSSENTDVWNYNNTEVLTGVEVDRTQQMTNGKDGQNTHNGYFPINETNFNGPQYFATNGNYGDIDTAYGNALVDASTAYQSIDFFTAYGGTQPADGLDMAKEIFQARDNTTYTYRSGSKQTVERNKVVIFFTDGQPGNYSTSNQYSEANKVVEKAYELKQNVGAKIFSIGVFGVADATPLTYVRHETTNDNHSDYEYDQGWVNTISNQKTSTSWNWIFPTTSTDTIRSYLNRYWLSSDPTSYGETPNDTIYDYMSTVSSNFPNARQFISDYWAKSGENAGDGTTEGEDPAYQSWEAMVSALRGERIANYGSGEGKENYYRLASNTESLIEAFKSAAKVTEVEIAQDVGEMDSNVKTIDFINDSNFNIPSSNGALDVEVKVVSVTKSADGTITEHSSISIEEYNATHTNQIFWSLGDDNKSVIVTGFDYNSHCVTAENNDAAKLVIKVRGLTPKDDVTGESLTSNKNTSGVYASDELLKPFPTPSISRYKYTLNVGNMDKDAVFDADYILSAAEGTVANGKSVLLRDGSTGVGQTLENLSNGTFSKSNIGNGATVYAEYITNQGADGNVNPSDYNLSIALTHASSDASAYTYYLSDTEFLYGEAQTDRAILSTVSPVSMLTTQNGNLYVTSKANNKTVTIRNSTEGEYADKDREFPITVTLTKDGSAATDFNETINGVTFTNGVATIPMKDGDSTSITLPTDYGLSVADNSNPPAYSNITYKLDTGDFGTTPVSTDTNADRDIVVKHIRDEVTDTGVLEETNPLSLIMYVLAGALAIAAGGTAYYSKRKKEEN